MVNFDGEIILHRFNGLPNILPGYALFGKSKKEEILWKGIFKEQTSEYLLIGSGKYFHLSGIMGEMYKDEYKDDSFYKKMEGKFAYYVLEGIVVFHDSDREIICGGKIADYNIKNFCDSKNPFGNYLFKRENGTIANTDNEKNILIEKNIRKIKSSYRLQSQQNRKI